MFSCKPVCNQRFIKCVFKLSTNSYSKVKRALRLRTVEEEGFLENSSILLTA